MPTLRVSDGRGPEPLEMYYEVHGNGPVRIVLIGGFGNICHQWDLQVDYFMREPDLFSVCICDNRGGGMSSSPKGKYKSVDMALDVLELMDFLHWRRFHVVGLSLGGMIAQELAHACMDRVVSLTLESTFAYFNGLPRKAYLNLVLAGPPLKTIDEFTAHVVGKLLFPQEWLDSPAPENVPYATNREHMVAFTRDRFAVTGLQDKAGRGSQQNAVITHSMSPRRLSHIKHSQMPVLVLCGTQDDVIIQPASSKYLAKQLGARLEIFEGAGHAIRLQFPEAHNELLKSHILGAVRKEKERLADRIVSSLAVLRGVSTGATYEARASAVREELEREFRRNGGRHHLIVRYGRPHATVNTSRRISLRQSQSSLRRKSRASLISSSDQTVGEVSGTSVSMRQQKARFSLSSGTLKTSLHDLFAPAEVNSPNDANGPSSSPPVAHPTSASFLTWLFPSIPPVLTIEREVVVEQLEFGQHALENHAAVTKNHVTASLSAATPLNARESDDPVQNVAGAGDAAENHPRQNRGFLLPTFRAVRVGFSDVMAAVTGRAI
ncbi:hypothetical protein HDU77_003664 [Chytriomyces hyalinus]|nr:hypothetical protein HDU77_003664 [Chytriomyces hyalinus]